MKTSNFLTLSTSVLFGVLDASSALSPPPRDYYSSVGRGDSGHPSKTYIYHLNTVIPSVSTRAPVYTVSTRAPVYTVSTRAPVYTQPPKPFDYEFVPDIDDPPPIPDNDVNDDRFKPYPDTTIVVEPSDGEPYVVSTDPRDQTIQIAVPPVQDVPKDLTDLDGKDPLAIAEKMGLPDDVVADFIKYLETPEKEIGDDFSETGQYFPPGIDLGAIEAEPIPRGDTIEEPIPGGKTIEEPIPPIRSYKPFVTSIKAPSTAVSTSRPAGQTTLATIYARPSRVPDYTFTLP